IISDDEFTRPKEVLTFGRRVLDLDASVNVCFGKPIDVLGNPVSSAPLERRAQTEHRKRYVCDAHGNVEWDSQRDRVYTNRLATGLAKAYPKYAQVMATHIAAYAAWQCLEDISSATDPFRMVRMPLERRQIQRHAYLQKLRALMDRVNTGAAEKRWMAELPNTAEAVLDIALDRFGRYHSTRALKSVGSMIVVEDPKLCLYYRNRLNFLEA
ncbi:MAG: hypothetical protein GWP91_10910, partial [Rhodobacterales bacterium]|nr:hypothetical protein [Rhodobacterales bacterium]